VLGTTFSHIGTPALFVAAAHVLAAGSVGSTHKIKSTHCICRTCNVIGLVFDVPNSPAGKVMSFVAGSDPSKVEDPGGCLCSSLHGWLCLCAKGRI
jgi:hypothetical protein